MYLGCVQESGLLLARPTKHKTQTDDTLSIFHTGVLLYTVHKPGSLHIYIYDMYTPRVFLLPCRGHVVHGVYKCMYRDCCCYTVIHSGWSQIFNMEFHRVRYNCIIASPHTRSVGWALHFTSDSSTYDIHSVTDSTAGSRQSRRC